MQPKQHSAPLLRFSERMETIITNLQVRSSEAFLFGIWKAVQIVCYFSCFLLDHSNVLIEGGKSICTEDG